MQTGFADPAAVLNRRGYTDPAPLLSAADAAAFAAALRAGSRALPPLREAAAGPVHWAKSAHLRLPALAALGRRPEILTLVTRLLGPDVLLWGAALVSKGPGAAHRWHVDVEHMAWQGITVWLGLTNVNATSGIRLIPGSHRFQVAPQTLGARIDLADDEATLAALRLHEPAARIVQPAMQPGAFIIFAGRVWHATVNETRDPRDAVILQYCRPDALVKIPRSYELPTSWDSRPPWVMQAAGTDRFRINHVAGSPHDESEKAINFL